jgi:hypothetical protein
MIMDEFPLLGDHLMREPQDFPKRRQSALFLSSRGAQPMRRRMEPDFCSFDRATENRSPGRI